MLRLASLLVAAVLIAAPALAAPKPVFGPPPAWVQVAEVPPAPPTDDAPALQTLLDDNQSRLTPQRDHYYNRRITRVLKTASSSRAT